MQEEKKKGKIIENRRTGNKRETESSTQSYPYSTLMKYELVKILPVKPGS